MKVIAKFITFFVVVSGVTASSEGLIEVITEALEQAEAIEDAEE